MLEAQWQHLAAIVNLRCDLDAPQPREAVRSALRLAVPASTCSTACSGDLRLVWAGPDDWFVLAAQEPPGSVCERLRDALHGTHHAVTDVSSAYAVLRIAGETVRDVLAQGCPIDLHPRVFGSGCAAGSHFFKTAVWLWRSADAPAFELLVRTSFAGYVVNMLRKCCEVAGTSMCELPPSPWAAKPGVQDSAPGMRHPHGTVERIASI